jgi:hypothetical protein
MQVEINELRVENEKLLALFNEHDKAIAYMAVIQSQSLKDIMSYFRLLTSSNRSAASAHKKSDDDLIN